MKIPATSILLTSAKLITGNSIQKNKLDDESLKDVSLAGEATSNPVNHINGIDVDQNNDGGTLAQKIETVELSKINKILKRKRRLAMRNKALLKTKILTSRQKRNVFSINDLDISSLGLSRDQIDLYNSKLEKQLGHWMTQFAEIEHEILPENLTNDPQAFEDFLLLQNSMRASTSFSKTRSPLLQLLNPYGCHCNFEMMPSPYTGEPVNAFDAACKVLQDGYRCIGMDDGQECSDNSEEYGTVPRYMRQHDKSRLIDTLDIYCRHENPDNSCGYDLCLVEAYFINTVFNLLQSGKRIDIKKNHRMGFDPMTECTIRPEPTVQDYYGNTEYEYYYVYGEDEEHAASSQSNQLNKEDQFQENLNSISPDKNKNDKKKVARAPSSTQPKFVPDICCGRFPERQPFNPGTAGQKDCCERDHVSTVFNTITHMCCADGSAMKLGEC